MNKQKQTQKTKSPRKQPEIEKAVPEQTLTIPQKTRNILATVEDKLFRDLDHQFITIPSKPIPFEMQGDRKDQKRQQWLRLQKVIEQKQKIKKKLLAVENSEKLLQQEIRLSTLKQRSTFSMRPKSELSPQDIARLKELKKEQQKFQTQLQEKTKMYEEAQLKYKQQQRELGQRYQKENNEKKKVEIRKRLEELSNRSKQRAERLEEEKKEVARVKMKKKLHLQLMQKWQKAQKQFEEFKHKQLEERMKQQSIDLSELKEHEQKYEEILRKNRDELSRKRMQASRMSNKLFKSKFHQSKFYTLIVEEEEKNKSKDQEKKSVIIDLVERRKEFAESVKKNIVPMMKIKSQQSPELEKSGMKKIPFDYQEARKIGLKYLEVSKCKGSKLKEKQKSRQMSELSQITRKSPKYHDYLTQNRRNHEKMEGKSLRLERNYQVEVQEAKNIMKKTNFSDKQKIQRVKMLAERMQFDPKTSKSSTLLKKIQAKMQILEALQ